MKKVFVDTNILLDIFLERDPFYKPAQILWSRMERKDPQGFISALSVSHIYYIVRKLGSKEKAQWAVETLAKIFKIVAIDQKTIQKSLALHFSDFEDALQYTAAVRCGAKALISRDGEGFQKGKLPVMDAGQFLCL